MDTVAATAEVTVVVTDTVMATIRIGCSGAADQTLTRRA